MLVAFWRQAVFGFGLRGGAPKQSPCRVQQIVEDAVAHYVLHGRWPTKSSAAKLFADLDHPKRRSLGDHAELLRGILCDR